MVKPADKPLDRLGREIKVGDYVVNAAQSGSSATMNFGMVVALPVKVRDVLVKRAERDANSNWIPAVYEAHEYHKVRVQPCDNDGTFTMEQRHDAALRQFVKTDKAVRAVTIEHLDRIAVVSLV